jgi:hypothetical protein
MSTAARTCSFACEEFRVAAKKMHILRVYIFIAKPPIQELLIERGKALVIFWPRFLSIEWP